MLSFQVISVYFAQELIVAKQIVSIIFWLHVEERSGWMMDHVFAVDPGAVL